MCQCPPLLYSQAVQIEQSVPLAPLTTLRVGGPARYLAKIESEADLVAAVEFARTHSLPVFVLGGGSNLVVSDAGFDGLVLQMDLSGPSRIEDDNVSVTYTVPAGTDWNAFVFEVCTRGLSGVECLAGIPGLVGGTPVQNVGAYGQEVAETILSVRALDLTSMHFVSLPAAECCFAYRRSIFNSTEQGRYIVTQVSFRFDPARPVQLTYADLKSHFAGKSPTPLEVYDAVREIRHAKGMLLVEGEPDCRSAGSFFKNPVVSESQFLALAQSLQKPPDLIPHWPAGDGKVKLAAAWLLDQAGFHKGFSLGQAGISSRHTLALINRGNATAADILALRDEIQHQVLRRFAISLEQEPVTLSPAGP